ncbi:hypothetical protein AALO_G00167140 [Alosa alosa]|uniref:ZP domain-containing protein n=1 Tax=Alosa alosa TaxID=278164 RepID=A0AAV6GBT0_9TELE|nr:zona pellucida sperm-binding protein 3-like [Alosa alosa]KAG5272583.1 hypothetical protein AALO_G00167140 [Alosa alosa]
MCFLQQGVILILVAACLAQDGGFNLDCRPDAVTIKWPQKLTQEQVQNPYTFLLGNCLPSSVNEDGVLFHVGFNDCLFQRAVFEDKIIFMNLLSYRPNSAVPSVFHIVDCVFDRPALLTPLAAQSGIPGTNEEKVVFSMELMNDDYSGPAPSTTFTVGSKISLRATVAVRTDAPQQIFLNECVMTESSDPYLANETYTIITDEGCLLESKYGNATFLPREKPSEIRLSLAAFGFADTEEVYLHCKLVSWQAQNLDVDMKACYYRKDKRKWELLDDSSRSDLCSCCDSICQQRARGLWQNVAVGPIRILHESKKDSAWKGPEGSTVFWLLVVAVPVVLLIATGTLALSYYLCIWRGGRLGYRPSRDLLNKY